MLTTHYLAVNKSFTEFFNPFQGYLFIKPGVHLQVTSLSKKFRLTIFLRFPNELGLIDPFAVVLLGLIQTVTNFVPHMVVSTLDNLGADYG